jgi:hypothetical protein
MWSSQGGNNANLPTPHRTLRQRRHYPRGLPRGLTPLQSNPRRQLLAGTPLSSPPSGNTKLQDVLAVLAGLSSIIAALRKTPLSPPTSSPSSPPSMMKWTPPSPPISARERVTIPPTTPLSRRFNNMWGHTLLPLLLRGGVREFSRCANSSAPRRGSTGRIRIVSHEQLKTLRRIEHNTTPQIASNRH